MKKENIQKQIELLERGGLYHLRHFIGQSEDCFHTNEVLMLFANTCSVMARLYSDVYGFDSPVRTLYSKLAEKLYEKIPQAEWTKTWKILKDIKIPKLLAEPNYHWGIYGGRLGKIEELYVKIRDGYFALHKLPRPSYEDIGRYKF